MYLFNDGVQVADITMGDPFGVSTTPAWGGIGDTWFDITGTDGDVFDEIRVLGFGFSPTTFMDDITWNPVVTCDGDANGDGMVNFFDLIAVIVNWGDCPAPPESCGADVNGDGTVNFHDLLVVFGNWGCGHTPCDSSADCDDGDPCTLDICFGGRCINIPIHGCDP